MLWALSLVLIIKSVWGEDIDYLVVNTKQGDVRGYKARDGDFFVFYGVPYATAPTGTQKFQGPQLPPVRTDIFEAVNKHIVCPQYSFLRLVHNSNKEERENCLIANIYVPNTKETNLPVLVYVHGGAYNFGFGDFVTPKHLAMSKKAIIVNFNYRLGAHGFLCLGTKDIPGNAGMKDQVALLRWIKENIASFGGNPKDVTIAGYSAGASSVGLLMLSKMANGLFSKIIPESGANIAVYSVQIDPIESAKNYAKQLNFTNVDDMDALEDFYKTASFDLLTSVNVINNVDGTFGFTPCVERETGVERFLDDSPYKILNSGNYQKLPMLYGFTEMEGIVRLNLFDIWKDMMNIKFSDFLPANLQFESEDEKEEVAKTVKQFYFGDKLVGEDNIMGYVTYLTDILFAYPIFVSVRLEVQAGNSEVYVYKYVYTHEHSPIVPYKGIRGAEHCAQTWTVQDGLNPTHFDESIASDGYKNMKQVLRELWMNFVTTGKPVPKGSPLPMWLPASANATPYMILDEVLELKKDPMMEKTIQFWDEIYSTHYRHPTPPRISQILNIEL